LIAALLLVFVFETTHTVFVGEFLTISASDFKRTCNGF